MRFFSRGMNYQERPISGTIADLRVSDISRDPRCGHYVVCRFITGQMADNPSFPIHNYADAATEKTRAACEEGYSFRHWIKRPFKKSPFH